MSATTDPEPRGGNHLQPQTWADWLLDSYAASSPVATEFFRENDDNYDDNAEHCTHTTFQQTSTNARSSHESPMSAISSTSSASTQRSVSSPSTLSPYAPYSRVGRGGAGNFYWHDPTDPDTQTAPMSTPKHRSTLSLAQRRAAATKLERLHTAADESAVIKPRTISSQYVHVGRGGAANLAIAQGSEAQHIAKSPRSPIIVLKSPLDRNAANTATSAGPIGRGGAGNASKAEEQRRRVLKEQQEIERVQIEKRREKVELEVDALLMPPPGARLAVGRRSSYVENV
jgi:hypothetical protein